jgi:hypothetical protein
MCDAALMTAASVCRATATERHEYGSDVIFFWVKTVIGDWRQKLMVVTQVFSTTRFQFCKARCSQPHSIHINSELTHSGQYSWHSTCYV